MVIKERPLCAMTTDQRWVLIEEIREGTNLGDIDVDCRRMDKNSHPDMAFEVHIDNGIVKTATRQLPFYEEHQWIDGVVIEEGKKCSICFNGKWERIHERWSLVTEEYPWVFWIDNNNVLKGKKLDESQVIELATNVSDVDSIRGWQNVYYPERDDGLIVAYIVDNELRYRNFALQPASDVIAWELERTVDIGGKSAKSISLFRTNDYRVGFVVGTETGTDLLITSRNWAGIGIRDHVIKCIGEFSADFIAVNYFKPLIIDKIIASPYIKPSFLYANSFNRFYKIMNINDGTGNFGRIILFETKYELFNLDILDFDLVDSRGTAFSPISITKISPTEYELRFLDFNNAREEVSLVFKGLHGLNAAGYRFDSFEGTFMPIGLVPTEIPVPEVEEIWNE